MSFRTVLLIALFIGGCSVLPVRYEVPPAGDIDCGTTLALLDRDIETHTHFDPVLQRIPGQPFLRGNRWLASNAHRAGHENASQKSVGELSQLAVDAYLIEYERLPHSLRQQWQTRLQTQTLRDVLMQCRAAYLRQNPELTPDMLERLSPPDNYSAVQRFFGIYPLTRRLANASIENYRREMRARVDAGAARRFSSAVFYRVQEAATGSAVRADGQALLQRHAPLLQVEQQSSADAVGSPRFDDNGHIRVDDQPAAFSYITSARHGQSILTQLNYVYWFARRPKSSMTDLYGGDLDALVWRVTLDSKGVPVLYDSIHACGCYHLLFLPDGTSIDTTRIKGEQPLYFSLPSPPGAATVRLKIEAGTHYLVDAAFHPADTVLPPSGRQHEGMPVRPYALVPYDTLLMLPAGDTRRSLFGHTGIIAQSSRLERYTLWPLGVPNAGAMREAGMQAIAFVGRRHFDDPDLLEQLGISLPAR